MTDNFLDYLKPTVIICNFFGITYIGILKSTTIAARILVNLFPLPFYAYYVYACYSTISINNPFLSESTVVNIGDLFGKVTTGLCLSTKGIYYFIRKEKIKQFIVQVSPFLYRKLVVFKSEDFCITN